MINHSFVSDGFRYSYIVPVPKPKEHYSNVMTLEQSLSVLYCLKYLNIA